MTGRRLGPRAAVAIVVVGFALARVAYYAMGVRFDSSPLASFWQYIDPALLRHHLLASVWSFHAQPPLYNLYLGVALKVGGSDPRFLFAATNVVLDLVAALALLALVRRLGCSWLVAALVSVAFFATPAVVLYENWLYVESLVLCCLVVAALGLHVFASGGGRRYAVLAFAALAIVVLVRTLFHPLWLVAVVAVVWLLLPGRRRELLVAAAVPVLVVAAFQIKASAQFGETSLTSCTGLSVARTTTYQVPAAERRALVARGVVSRFAILNPFFLPPTDPAFRHERHRGVAVLDQVRKSTGALNFGNAAYLGICSHYLHDGVKIAREKPDALRRGVQEGFEVYGRPASDYPLFTKRNRDAVHPVERPLSLVLGQVRRDPTSRDFSLGAQAGQIAWVIVIAYVLAFAYGIRTLLRARRDPAEPRAGAVTFAYALLTIAFVTIVGNVLEAGENNRFHFALDPLVVAILVAAAVQLVARRRRPHHP